MSDLQIYGALIPTDPGDDLQPAQVRQMLTEYYSASLPKWVTSPPTPTLATLTPASIVVNTPTLVTLAGTNFVPNSKVVVDGVVQLTQYVSATSIRYVAQASSVGTQNVAVRNGKITTATKPLTVTATEIQEEAPADTPPADTPPADPAPTDPTPTDPPPTQ